MNSLTGFLGLLMIWGLLYGFYIISLKSYKKTELDP